MSQNSFRPIHEAHAIAEQMIFFEFAPPLERVMPALISLKEELRSEFTSGDLLKSVKVNFVDDKPSSQEIRDAAGIIIFRPNGDNPREWAIKIEPELISIHCTNYTRWVEIWPVYERYVNNIFSKMAGSPSFLSTLGIKWLDQFMYDGEEDAYNALDLLREDSPYLHGNSFKSGSRWHCHTGWFDYSSIENFEVLNQLQVNSGHVNDGGHIRTAVTIDHNQQLRADKRIDQLGDFLPTTEAGRAALSTLMDTLHDGNKRVLANLLNDSSCKRVGLEIRQQG